MFQAVKAASWALAQMKTLDWKLNTDGKRSEPMRKYWIDTAIMITKQNNLKWLIFNIEKTIFWKGRIDDYC